MGILVNWSSQYPDRVELWTVKYWIRDVRWIQIVHFWVCEELVCMLWDKILDRQEDICSMWAVAVSGNLDVSWNGVVW